MREIKKKALSLILAAAMLLSLVPTALTDSPRSQRESFMAIAEAQLGYREKGWNGTKYGTWYGLPDQPWCAMFVTWCARFSGVPESVIPNFSGCLSAVNWYRQRGLWRTREYTPQAGDLLFLDGLEADGTRDGYADHVAIVERADATTIYTIEGNSINEMCERRERPRDESVMGYATPQYGTISAASGTVSCTQLLAPGYHLGGSFTISGFVSSGRPLIWLYVDIRDLDGNFYSSAQCRPNAKTADLYSLSGSLDFAQLTPGSYELFIEAVDSGYNYMQLRRSFKVGAADVDASGRHAAFAEAIQWCIDQGISKGTAAARFMPDAQCSRAEVVTFLWRAAGCPAAKSSASFSDVKSGSYYAAAVGWALSEGITAGVGGGRFAPDEKVTRAQFVTFLWRWLDRPAAGGFNPFNDVPSSHFACSAILWAYENGVTGGTGGQRFSPDSGATRAEVAAFLYRAMNPVEKPVEPVEPVDPVDPTEPTTEPTEPTEPAEPTTDPEASEETAEESETAAAAL